MAWNRTNTIRSVVRARPEFGADVLDVLVANEKVYVVARMGQSYWVQIALPGRLHEGYLEDSQLRWPVPAPLSDSTTVERRPFEEHRVARWNEVAKPSTLRLRPRDDSGAIVDLHAGDEVFVLARFTGTCWLRVQLTRHGDRDRVGYLAAWTLKAPVVSTSPDQVHP